MAVFTKQNNAVSGTSSADIILVPFGPFGDTGFIAGGGGIDELRFSSDLAGDFLVIGDNVDSIERVVIGTGTKAAADTSGTTALDVDATEAANALAIIGNAGANFILGTLFADTITGGAGADELYGGAGNDIFIVASAAHHPLNELIDGEGGFDTLQFTSTVAGDTLFMRADDDVEAIVAMGSAALHIDASEMANFSGTRITGNAAGNRLTGTDFADSLVGGAGNDTLDGGAGNDTITGGAGRDSLSGGAGDDLFIATQAELTGDTLVGGAGIDELRIDAAAAGATFNVGTMLDGVEVVSFGLGLTKVAVNVNAAGAGSGLVIFGTDAANIITGTSFSDALFGGSGNDVFVINAAGDFGDEELIEGGNGIDEIRFAGTTGVLVLGTGGFGGVTGIERASIANGANTGIDASALSFVTMTGGSGNNTLIGGAGNDTLVGGGGADSLDGGEASDLYVFNTAAESVAGEVIADSGTAGTDVIEYAGATGVLVLRAGLSGIEEVRLAGKGATGIDASATGAALVLLGNTGNNVLTGCNLDDTIAGGLGRDTLNGRDGDDLFTGAGAELSGDAINGGGGFDRIVVTGTAAVVLGAAITGVESVEGRNVNAAAVKEGLSLLGDADLASTLIGGAGADTITGSAGADRLSGGAGNDRFLVGSRAELDGDRLDGGAGNDFILFTPGADPLTVYFAGLGLPAGPALLLGMNGMSLAGVEEIRIAEGDAAAAVIADGSLQGPIASPAPEGFTLEQITDPDFVNALLVEGQLDILISIVSPGLLSLSREDQLVAIMEQINLEPETALIGFNTFVDFVFEGEAVDVGIYTDNFTSAGLIITGNDSANLIAGTKFADNLRGNGGDDVFVVSSGAHHPLDETIQGGTGHDEVWFTSGGTGDTLVLGFSDSGIEAVRVRALDGSYHGAANVDASRYGAAIELSGNDVANVLTGSRFGDILLGGFGDDLLQGGRGDDTLLGGAGSDALQGGLGNDLILNPHATLEEIDSVNGGAGIDTVRINDGTTFDMTQLGRRGFSGIERIELSIDGDSGNGVVVMFDRVLESVGDGGVLTIDGTGADLVQLTEEWTATEDGDYINWEREDLDSGTQVTLRIDADIQVGRVYIAVDGPDSLVGGPTDDTFLFTQAAIDENDVVSGGDGFDTIALAGFGDSFDITQLILSGIELIHLVDGGTLQLGDDQIDVQGSASADFMLVDAADLPSSIDGGDDWDTVVLQLDGDDTVDLGVLQNIEDVQFTGGGALALQGTFSAGNLSVQDSQDYILTLDGAELFSQLVLGGGDDSIVAGTALDAGFGTVEAGDGNDTLAGVPLGQYVVILGDGDDLYLFDAAATGRTVAGGNGNDTIAYDGDADASLFLSGASFEVLAAGDATGSLAVTVGNAGGLISITTGSGNDSISLASPGGAQELVHAGDGADTVSTLDEGDDVDLEGGDDTFDWEYGITGLAGWTIDGGAGSDTLHFMFVDGIAESVSIDFSATQNMVGGVFNFENLDAADVGPSLQFVVTAAATGSVISTSSALDQVTLGAGADVVDTGAGVDFVFGELTAGDDIDLGDDDDTFQLTGPVADGAQVDGGESFLGDKLRILGGGDLTIDLSNDGTVFLNFEILDASSAVGHLDVTVDELVSSVSTGTGDDVLRIDLGFEPLGGLTADGGEGVDTIQFVSSNPLFVIGIDLAGTSFVGFEHFDGAGSFNDFTVRASGTGSNIVTGFGDDRLHGAAGNDTLTGGAGDDVFIIDTAPGTDVDVITDFNAGLFEHIELLASAFPGLSVSFGPMDPDNFALGTEAADADDFIVYDQSTGNLYYDAEGNAGEGPVLFAVLSNQAALTAGDIYIV